MSFLSILEYPDKRLRTIAKPVDSVDSSLRTLIDDMFETMYEAPGIGLAATQVDVHKQLLILDISEDRSHLGRRQALEPDYGRGIGSPRQPVHIGG